MRFASVIKWTLRKNTPFEGKLTFRHQKNVTSDEIQNIEVNPKQAIEDKVP